MKKIGGIIFVIVGVIGVALTSIPKLYQKTTEKFPQLTKINSNVILVVSLVLVALGIFLLKRKRTRKNQEVPIFEGDKVVGYRRHS